MKTKFHPREKYCAICKNKFTDETWNNKLIFCSKECKAVRTQKQRDKWYKKNKMRIRQESMILRMPNMPEYVFQDCGHRVTLDFDPRRWRNRKRMEALTCQVCSLSPVTT